MPLLSPWLSSLFYADFFCHNFPFWGKLKSQLIFPLSLKNGILNFKKQRKTSGNFISLPASSQRLSSKLILIIGRRITTTQFSKNMKVSNILAIWGSAAVYLKLEHLAEEGFLKIIKMWGIESRNTSLFWW